MPQETLRSRRNRALYRRFGFEADEGLVGIFQTTPIRPNSGASTKES